METAAYFDESLNNWVNTATLKEAVDAVYALRQTAFEVKLIADGGEIDDSIIVDKNLTLTSDGDFTVTRAESFTEDLFMVSAGIFTIGDDASDADPGRKVTISGGNHENSEDPIIDNFATVILNEFSCLKENKCDLDGGGVYNSATATLYLKGGCIEQNAADNGGGIYNEGLVNFESGEIHENIAKNGGGIYNSGIVDFERGEIFSNTANNGGGVYISDTGGVDMTRNVVISSNEASCCGGGVYNEGVLSLTKDSHVSDNSFKAEDTNHGDGLGEGIYNAGILALDDDAFVDENNVYLAGSEDEDDNEYDSEYSPVVLAQNYNKPSSPIVLDLDKTVLGGTAISSLISDPIDCFVLDDSISEYAELNQADDMPLFTTIDVRLNTEIFSDAMSMKYTGEDFIPELEKISMKVYGDIDIPVTDNISISFYDSDFDQIDIPSNLGQYYGKIYFEGDDYLIGSESDFFEISIDKNTMNVEIAGYSGSYDGNKHSVAVNVVSPATNYEVSYGTNSGVYDLDKAPEFIDIGKYTTYVKVVAYGYEDYIGDGIVEITPVLNPVNPVNPNDPKSPGTKITPSTSATGSTKTGDELYGLFGSMLLILLATQTALIIKSRKNKS